MKNNKQMKDLSGFTHQYSLAKTLRFALKPVGKTFDHLKTSKLLEEDKERAEQYKKAKKIIDLYHKDFIEKTLNKVTLSLDDLKGFGNAYDTVKKDKKDKNSKEEFAKQQEKLRKTIVKYITDTPEYNRLFKKELLDKDLPEWLKHHPDAKASGLDRVSPQEYPKIIGEFKKWITYFTGFNENRKNIYTSEPQPTAIAHRIVHENLPRFLDNIDKWNTLLAKFSDIKKHSQDTISSLEQSMNIKLSSVFTLKYVNQCLNQRGIDTYNAILGGKSAEDGSKLQGVNEIINLYRQQKEHELSKADDVRKEDLRKNIKTLRGLKMQGLYKQILSDRESHSFLPDKFENDKELIDAIKEFYQEISKKNLNIDGKNTSVLLGLQSCLKQIKHGDIEKIYVSNTSLNNLSHECFRDWSMIKRALEKYAETIFPSKKNNPTKKELEDREKWIRNTKYFSLADLYTTIDEYIKTIDTDEKKEYQSIIQYFSNGKVIEKGSKKTENEKEIHVFDEVKKTWDEAKGVLQAEYDITSNGLHKQKETVKIIKAFLDSVMHLIHFVKPLYIETGGKTDSDKKSSDVFDKDASFYNDFDTLYERFLTLIKLYGKVRNYLTRKEFTVEKYKLNFENSTLLSGFDVNKESENTGVFFLKDDKYYLGIMAKQHNKLFKNIPEEAHKEGYRKVYYKLLPGANKMLPKVFFPKSNIHCYNPSDEILRIRNHATHSKNGEPQPTFDKHDFNLKDCHSLIDFFKQSIEKHPDWKHFNFKFSTTKQYNDISEFYREVEEQGYKITYSDISEGYINTCIDEGKLYLFQIYSKDFSDNKKSAGKPNLHTLYWKALFDENNLQDVVYKLSGGAEIFFRKASITYNNDIWQKGHHYNDDKKLKNKFKYPIIKDRRYAQDTYSFHVPITINFKAASNVPRFNDTVNTYLKDNPDVNILSIDRGERHLAYYTLLNQKGEIKKQGSFNTTTYHVKGEKEERRVDYRQKLHEREGERDKARKSWDTINTIKELKEGYLSQIVHRIATMMVQHNAIVVFEDLNFGFKRGRFKFEKQIYQKLEKMLIDKLNYLVFKDRTTGEIGGTLCGYQLTAPFESFKKLGKQTGFIFYVSAYHTSKICPATGFVNVLYPRYQNVKKSKEFFGTFDSIQFNQKEHIFEFHLHYSKFAEKKFIKKIEGITDAWTICTNGTRLQSKREKEQWKTKEVNLTDDIKSLLDKKGIEYKHGDDICEAIVAQDKDKFFFEKLFEYLHLTLQLRNSRRDTEEASNNNDYILSCVKDEHGHFFDSRTGDSTMPVNSDANGAYHIGLKGLWALQRINAHGIDRINLVIKNEEWYDFTQNKRYR